MVSSTMQSDASSGKSKRTNSLAFAQSDCHTCSSSGERCDRRRPQCSTCLDQGRKCGGFATPLSWDPKRMWSDNPATTISDASREGGTMDSFASHSHTFSPGRSRFRFVKNAPRPRKRRRGCPSQSQLGEREDLAPVAASPIPSTADEVPSLMNHDQTGKGPGEAEPLGETLDLSLLDSITSNLFDPTAFLDMAPDLSNLTFLPMTPVTTPDKSLVPAPVDPPAQDASPAIQDQVQADLINDELIQPAQDPTAASVSSRAVLELSPNDHDWLLELCKKNKPPAVVLATLTDQDDSEFCVLPLTGDLTVNPFRCKRQTSQGSRLLFHSILALCCQHLNRLTGSYSKEATENRRKATQLLECTLRSKEANSNFHLLEPMLILFTLDCTLSATGTWSTHLSRAHSMLQACGGPAALTTERIRAQVGMLIWWDATLALISRQGPIMDHAYMEFLVRWEKEDNWSFFDLTGCPGDLVSYLFDLAELARQNEIARSMKWISFNMTPVIEIEEKLNRWNHTSSFPSTNGDIPGLPDTEIERRFHESQDRYHCAEAWRYTLLLYLESVFRRDNGHRQSPAIIRLVRKTLDHTKCCRRTSQTQKQLLLPVFLAGSETSDPEMRDFVKDYCMYWGEKSGYSMFNSVPALLDEVWSSGMWWGVVVDNKTRGLGQGPTQVLLG